MRNCLLLLTAALALGACQSAPAPEPPSSAPTDRLPTGDADTCGAAGYASVLGKSHDSVPPAPAGKAVRIVCSTCPMTMDYNAARLNVIFDEKTGAVQKLTCG